MTAVVVSFSMLVSPTVRSVSASGSDYSISCNYRAFLAESELNPLAFPRFLVGCSRVWLSLSLLCLRTPEDHWQIVSTESNTRLAETPTATRHQRI